MELILMRHTSVAVHGSLVYGTTDVDVAASFPDEADAARRRLGAIWPEGPTVVVSSPARRCRVLADHVAGDHQVDERLWEMGFGQWELQPWTGVPKAEMAAWRADFVSMRPPGGESYGEVAARVHDALSDVIERSAPLDRVLVVCHGGVVRAALAHWLEIPLRRSFDVQIDFGSITHVAFRGHVPHLRLINHR